MRIIIIGATGFIGRELCKAIRGEDYKVVAVSRNAERARKILDKDTAVLEWDGKSSGPLTDHIGKSSAIINLAGESIASRRWTKQRKKILTESRTLTTRLLSDAISKANSKPSVVIQASAIGYYGTPLESPTDEDQPTGSGFLAELVDDWETAIEPAGNYVKRLVIARTGLVLGKGGDLLEKMLLPFRFYSGTVIGSGRQWMSWIHLQDHVRAIKFLLENEGSSGAYNLVSPNPVRMKEFIGTLADVVRKPAWFKLPGFVLKAALGEMAEETILSSQNIIPAKLLKEGFVFNYPHVKFALENLIHHK
jgi:uncharacterized protein (TIGR01777 family)